MAKRDDLARFPRPNVAVDIAVLTALPPRAAARRGSLAVLVQDPHGASAGRSLPGRFLREGQTIAECVADVLRLKAGLGSVRVEAKLLKVFDNPQRDPRGWTLSLAHSLTLAPGLVERATAKLMAITVDGALESGEPLLFDHNAIVSAAAAAIRERYEQLPDPDSLLEGAFTMAELRSVHEAVLGEPLLKDTFRRRMEPSLKPLTEPDGSPALRSAGGRPAQVYVRSQDRPQRSPVQRRLRLSRG